MSLLLNLARISRPLHLFLAALTYLLGAGIANYLGISFNSVGFWLGMSWVVLIHLTSGLLVIVFKPVTEPTFDDEALRERIYFRNIALSVAGTALTASAIVTLLMLRADLMAPETLLMIGIAFFLSLAYAVPPFRFVNTGFGELILAITLTNLPASIAFLLQAGVYHRLVGFITFPLILLGLAWLIVLDFPTFAVDQKYERRTLLRRIGWERAVPLHQGLVISAYLLISLAPLANIPLSLIWPAFLTLPFAALQILLVRGLALGGRPNWVLLVTTSTAVFGLTIYFITLTFWLR